MTDRREESRRKARQRRAAAKRAALETANTNCALAANAIAMARRVVADPKFIRFLRLHGIESMPAFLDVHVDAKAGQGGDPPAEDRLAQVALEFAVTWRFLHPVISQAEATAYLDSTWPGFISELKDAFIALVMDGPFPRAMSGHRGRTHHGKCFPK